MRTPSRDLNRMRTGVLGLLGVLLTSPDAVHTATRGTVGGQDSPETKLRLHNGADCAVTFERDELSACARTLREGAPCESTCVGTGRALLPRSVP
jgi:hypothetical protein